MKFILYPLFIICAITMPWWLTVPIGIIVATMPYGGVVAVVGGVIMDATFGAPIPVLFGFAHLYTSIFCIAAILVTLLAERVVD